MPLITLTTPGGNPASTNNSAHRKVDRGVSCDGLMIAEHPDAKTGREGNRTIGSLYDLITASSEKQPNPIGEWNSAHIISKGKHVEHWLNGRKLLEYERSSPEFRAIVARSKYKKIPGFGEWKDGHILLQDHGNTVSFRNIKILTKP